MCPLLAGVSPRDGVGQPLGRGQQQTGNGAQGTVEGKEQSSGRRGPVWSSSWLQGLLPTATTEAVSKSTIQVNVCLISERAFENLI